METRLVAPFAGTVVATPAGPSSHVRAGDPVIVIEAMKMEHEVVAEHDAFVAQLSVAVGETVTEGQPLAVLARANGPVPVTAAASDPEERDDLKAVQERHDIGLDHRRPAAVGKRHDQGRRTARENLADLLDPGSFVEYGPLVIAPAQTRRWIANLFGDPASGWWDTAGKRRPNVDTW
ncbi:MAG TPA: biotin/lipoyl-containing protein [Solirubrobacteraceae bacterium]|nr:biotin/lipoyl-containing protein [Solirubrobacteraceae bacterium]